MPVPVSLTESLIRIASAILGGIIVAWFYRLSVGRNRRNNQGLPTTIVLLSALIAVVTQVIGESTARAFGLVGALSIVRFRAVVEDTGDTAFVIFAVVIGMGFGAGQLELSSFAIPLVGLTAVIMSLFQSSPALKPYQLTLRVPMGTDPDTLLASVFGEHLITHRLNKVETAQKGAQFELTYVVKLQPKQTPLSLINALSKLENVQGVEWKSGS
jgi:hypothetical protein